MAKAKRGVIIPPHDGIVVRIRLEDGTEVTANQRAIARSSGIKGPGGKPLDIKTMVPALEVEVEVRKGVVDKFFSVKVTDDAKDLIRSQNEADRLAALEEDLTQERQKAYAPGDTNPYTFLPYLSYRPDEGFLVRPTHRTTPPAGLHSGRLRVRFTVAAPLATFGGETWDQVTHKSSSDPGGTGFVFEALQRPGDRRHRVVSLLTDQDGRPTLAGSAIKGMLRSWYEFITSSDREIDPSGVAWRDTVIDADARETGILRLWQHGHPLDELSADDQRELPEGVTATIAPVVPLHLDVPDGGDARATGEAKVRAIVRDWEPAKGEVRQLRHGMLLRRRDQVEDGPTQAWLQVGVGVGKRPTVGVRLLPDHGGRGLDGLPTEPPDAVPVPHEALLRWWEAHRRGDPNRQRAKVDLEAGEGSVELAPPDATVLRDGQPVFFQRQGARFTYLSHVRNGRWAVLEIPETRFPSTGHLPDDDDRLDPARRAFGTAPDGKQDHLAAWAGRVRVASVSYEGEGRTERFVIRPLSTPKVQAAGFYLDGGRPDAAVGWRDGDAGRLAGTKAYWHQVPVPDGHGQVADIAERVRVSSLAIGVDGVPARTKDNTTLEALLDGTFEAELWFEDLNDHDLHALLLATSLRFDDKTKRHGCKLGLGKPLGFGSLSIELAEVALVAETSPTDLSLRPATTEDIDERIRAGREHWFGTDRAGLQIADGVADLDAVRPEAFGYPGTGRQGRREPGGGFNAEPKAADVLGTRGR